MWSVVVCGTGYSSNYLGIMCGLVDPSVEHTMRKMPYTASLMFHQWWIKGGFQGFRNYRSYSQTADNDIHCGYCC